MAKAPTDIRSLARAHTKGAIKVLSGIMNEKSAPPASRVAAAEALLNRGWGKPQSHVDVTSAGERLTFQSEALSDFASFLAGSVAGEADRAAEDVGTERSVLPDPVRSGETRH